MLQWISNNFALLLCSIFGVLFLIIEAIIPGIGVTGIAGTALSLCSLVIIAINYGPTPTIIATILLACIIATVLYISIRSLSRGKLNKKYVLGDDMSESDYIATTSKNVLVGMKGETLSTLRPYGIATINGKRQSVTTRGEFINKGEKITVISTENLNIIVERA